MMPPSAAVVGWLLDKIKQKKIKYFFVVEN